MGSDPGPDPKPASPAASSPPATPAAAPTPATPGGQVTDGRERRKNPRQPLFGKATLTMLDGHNSGAIFDVQTRDLSLSGLCFLLREQLTVGQTCRVDIPGEGTHLCEVVRSRPLSNGRYEMGVQFRKQVNR
jgi:hypothetical protein